MRSLLASVDPKKGFGSWNWSNYSNPKLDALLEQGFATVDEKKREGMAREAATLALKDVGIIPLHHQIAVWALKRPLSYAARTDEYTFAHHIRAK
jgi:peptide/nickel transport system substrate-binding protein